MTRDVITTDQAEEVIQSLDMAAGRRAFIKALGFGAVGAAVFGAAEGIVSPAAAQAALTDTQILNFALNLEYLEATFYSYAYSGKDIPAANVGANPGTLNPGAKVPFTSSLVKAYAAEIANEELRHVEVLRAVLGANAVSRPAIDINSTATGGPNGMAGAFQQAATAAGIPGAFNAYANDTTFLIASYIFEDVGVTAYHGAASLIQNPTYLNYAAGILAVEAYHAGIIRTSLFAQQSTTIQGYTDQISALRSELANNNRPLVDDVGIGNVGAPTLVDVDAPNATQFVDIPGGDAIAYDRTVRQVLNIVYGAQNANSGLFFPNGINAGPTNNDAG